MAHMEVPLPPGDDDYADNQAAERPAAAAEAGFLAVMRLMQQQQQMFLQQQQQQFLQMQASVRGQQPATAAGSRKVKLPPFWEKDAAAWFRTAEEILEECGVTEAKAKYRAILMHVPQHLVERARGVLNAADAAADPYEELKLRLVELLTPSKLDQVNSLIWGPELGGRRPSELMDGMLAALPPGEAAGLIFKGLFLHRLPADMRELVALQFITLPAMELAAYADTIWDSRNAKKATVAAVAVPEDAVESSSLDNAVAALALNKQPRRGSKPAKKRGGRGGRSGGQGGGQDGGQSGSQRNKYLCGRHLMFGDQAWSCEEPQACQFSEN